MAIYHNKTKVKSTLVGYVLAARLPLQSITQGMLETVSYKKDRICS